MRAARHSEDERGQTPAAPHAGVSRPVSPARPGGNAGGSADAGAIPAAGEGGEDALRPEPGAGEALRAELSAKSTRQVVQHAVSMGVSDEKLDAADQSPDPKAAIIDLILAKQHAGMATGTTDESNLRTHGVSRPASPERFGPERRGLPSGSSGEARVEASVSDVLSRGLGLAIARTEIGSEPGAASAPAPEPSTGGAATSDGLIRLSAGLPEDVQQSPDELREPSGRAPAGRWLLVAAIYALAGIALCFAMDEMYFGGEVCDDSESRSDTEDLIIGGLPAMARGAIIIWAISFSLRKLGLARTDVEDNGLMSNLLVVGRASDARDAEIGRLAGWAAIVGSHTGAADAAEPQPGWEQVRKARRLDPREAATSAVVKLVLWHWVQPAIYLFSLSHHHCLVASFGEWQQRFAAVVAAREVLYLGSTILGPPRYLQQA